MSTFYGVAYCPISGLRNMCIQLYTPTSFLLGHVLLGIIW